MSKAMRSVFRSNINGEADVGGKGRRKGVGGDCDCGSVAGTGVEESRVVLEGAVEGGTAEWSDVELVASVPRRDRVSW